MKQAAAGSARVGSPKMSVVALQFLLLVFAGWMNRHQAEVVAYLQEENRVLREQLGGRRLRFTDAQRRSSPRRAASAADVRWNRSPDW
jgi:hypothetical protein